jgi:hypothetical protein
VNRYQDASYVPVASFEEDADLTTARAPGTRISGDGDNLSILHEGRIPWCQGDWDYNGVFLGWNRVAGAPQIPQVDRSHRAGGQSGLSGQLANRCAFAR